ncbi:DNA polymerase III subunit delta [Anaerovorax sp. IOR16]|uniref:DNA polymerase III subunit delta n=1 Tax=Anaerovorax sp. IOR16 TaxID=2773458 RepID=UPI0019D2D7F2|nr:DNA polymerase III subunit delta [Anaerovorax sp. IOR16]
MAYQRKQATIHAYQKIQNEMKDGKLKQVLFFYGRESYLVNWALEVLIDKYINPACKELDISQFDGTLVSVKDIINTCETLPLFSEKKLVIIKDFAPLSGIKRKGFGDEEEKKLIEYIKDLPETTMLIFSADSADKRRKLYKSVAQTGEAYEFSQLDEKQLTAFINKRLKSAERIAKPGVISQFIAYTGYYDKESDYTLYCLENDIKKALFHSQNPELTLEDFKGTASANIDTNVFAMMDALSKGDKQQGFLLLHNILQSGENTYKILALICSQFELMFCVKEMQKDGLMLSAMVKELGAHEFRVKKALQFADRYTIDHLRTMLKRAYEVDNNIKSGILDQTLALELLIAET